MSAVLEQVTPLGALHITERELEALAWAARGKRNSEIAQIMQHRDDGGPLSAYTVKNFIQALCRKLNAPNRQACVWEALRLGLLKVDEKPKPTEQFNRYVTVVKDEPPVITHRFGHEVEIFSNGKVKVLGKEVKIGLIEKKLLIFFAENGMNRVHSRDFILDKVYGSEVAVHLRCVDTHMSRLRDIFKPTSWKFDTVRGEGYALVRG
ncbi:winged helix-turn-helix domain-containing protein [Candidatus Parcubacteria bacterium]|nr:winged helix-turn-helix domain-containing protein [Candidatus Parcubacteria bacterium]